MSTSEIPVFFYGLFMDQTLLASKGVRASGVATGFVDGFRLRIGERATLIREPNSRAYGVLMNMTPADAAALYSEQSVADYVAETVVVRLPGNGRKSATCYNLPAEKLSGTNPEYAKALLSLAADLGLPDSYLDEIRRVGPARGAIG